MLSAAIASSDPTSSAQLLASLEQTGLVKSVRQWKIPGNKVSEIAGALPDVVLLDLPQDPESFLAFGSELRRTDPAIKLVACSASVPPSPQLLLDAMRSGVQEFLAKPVAVGALKEMLARFEQELGGRQKSTTDSKFVAVLGAKGGAGATTVAVNLSTQLTSAMHKKVILLDFARPLGNAHLQLDIKPSFGLRDAVGSHDRLDGHFLASLLVRHKTNVQLLGGAMSPEAWDDVAIPSLTRLIHVAQMSFDFTVADLGSHFSADMASILELADSIVVVTEADVPALWNLERRLVTLKNLGVAAQRVRIVMNRWHKGDEEALHSMHKDLVNRSTVIKIPNEYRRVSQAINNGVPLLESRRDAINDSFRQFAAGLVGQEAASANSKKSSFSGLFSFSGKVA